MKGSAIDTKDVEVREHKCLLYWHSKNMLRIPTVEGKGMNVFPGYNTFDSSLLDIIYKQCTDIIDSGRLELKGVVEGVDGSLSETFSLSKVSSKELQKILDATYNPETIDDLSNPDIVPAAYAKQAYDRRKKLEEAIGTEADNVTVVEESKGL